MPAIYNAAEMDFSVQLRDYPVRPNKHVPKPQLVPEKKKTRQQARRTAKSTAVRTVKIAAVTVSLLILFSMLIFERAQLIQLNTRKAAAEKNLETVQSETVRLEAAFNSKVSVDNVEEYAKNELGMIKRQKYQIRFFPNDGEDEILLADAFEGQ